MSGASTQGVGAAVSANADVVSAISAAAIKKVLVENLVTTRPPATGLQSWSVCLCLNKPRTPFARQHDRPIHRSASPETLDFMISDFVIPRIRLRDYLSVSV